MEIAVVGLGYVGLPLAIEVSKKYSVLGFDINQKRVQTLINGTDPNGEVSAADLQASNLRYSWNPEELKQKDIIIVAVPTPIDDHNIPDLTPLLGASKTVAQYMSPGTIVVFESTVYPGATEEDCVPLMEKVSGLTWKKDFFVGYSPERINPGDKVHTFATIKKVVSGDTPETLDKIAKLYNSVVTAGIHKATTIRVAEAAKVIENTQRDINIALMNELRIIFDKMGISTKEVLEAAGTKWNFLPFEPGLVGGHCIGVDPYYLAYKAEEIGHHPQIIRAGRRINDGMGRYFARVLIKKMIDKGTLKKGASVLVCGITFKENVPDIRNSRVIDVISELQDFSLAVSVWDPVAYPEEVKQEYGIDLLQKPEKGAFDAILFAVKHAPFLELGKSGLHELLNNQGIFFDLKEMFN